MAYGRSNEVQNVIATFDKNQRGDKIRVSRIDKTNYDSSFIDIRNMYTDEEGELRYTSRGVRFNSEIALDIILALVESLSEDEKVGNKEEFMKAIQEKWDS